VIFQFAFSMEIPEGKPDDVIASTHMNRMVLDGFISE
jgi:NMD protein affecting ribosome stability and mRNA decay